MKLEKLEDFGEKIAGAKKDLWKERGLNVDDLNNMTTQEQAKNCTKNVVWPVEKGYYQELVDSGVPIESVFFQKAVRDSLPPKPLKLTEDSIYNFVNVVHTVKDKVETVTDNSKIFNLTTFLADEGFIELAKTSGSYTYYRGTDKFSGIELKTKMLNVPSEVAKLKQEVERKKFLFSDREKILSDYFFKKLVNTENSTNNLTIEKLHRFSESLYLIWYDSFLNRYYSKIEDDPNSYVFGEWYVLDKNKVLVKNAKTREEAEEKLLELVEEQDTVKTNNRKRKERFKYELLDENQVKDEVGNSLKRNATPEDFLENIGVRGGQFGNWENIFDRQLNMNCCFNSFQNIAIALGIQNHDISLDGKLAIAFGARGNGKAMAHYEPDQNVINLTKIRGAGSLVHEWFHALDAYINSVTNYNPYNWSITEPHFGTTLEQDNKYFKVINAVLNVVNAMKTVPENLGGGYTTFYKNAKKLDNEFAKDGGYWRQEYEMFARAGANYMAEKYDMLGMKDSYGVAHARRTGHDIPIYPMDDEAERINKAFDELFKELIDANIFHVRNTVSTEPTSKVITSTTNHVEQMNLFDM